MTNNITITVSDEALRQIKKITAIGDYISHAEMIRDSIALNRYLVLEKLKGAKIMLKYPNGKTRELISLKD